MCVCDEIRFVFNVRPRGGASPQWNPADVRWWRGATAAYIILLYNIICYSRKSSTTFVAAYICTPRRKVFVKRKSLVKKKAFPTVAGDSFIYAPRRAAGYCARAHVRAHCCPPATARRSPINRRGTKTRSRSNIGDPPDRAQWVPTDVRFFRRKTVFNQTARQTHVIRW